MSDKTGSKDKEKSRRNEPHPPDLYSARITGSREALAKLMQGFELDMGCRPHPEVNPDGTSTLLFFATQERIREIQAAGHVVELGENVSALGRERQAEVGKGDRFEGGRITPRGLAKKPLCEAQGGDKP